MNVFEEIRRTAARHRHHEATLQAHVSNQGGSMKLYFSPRSRAVRPRWLLEELGVPYELVRVDLAAGEQKKPEHLAVHPHGAVPALVDGDLKLFESAAICAHLADKYPEKHLAPPLGTTDRALYYQWLVYSVATLEPPILQVFLNTIMLPEAQRSAAAAAEGRKGAEACAQVLEKALAGKSFLVGDHLTAADVMIASTLGWAQMMGILGGHPDLEAYVGRLMQRPAAQRANGD
jgi:glutathione S-transferase